jgi:hypothetical protein
VVVLWHWGASPETLLESLFGTEQGQWLSEMDEHASKDLLDHLQRDIRSKVVKATKKKR